MEDLQGCVLGSDEFLERVGSSGGAGVDVAQNGELAVKSLPLFPAFPKAEEAEEQAQDDFDGDECDDSDFD
jgi:hypothetical protein